MRIGIANDHHGIELKNRIINHLRKRKIEYSNFGCDDDKNKENIDYIDYAVKLCNAINNKKVDLGILICGTGIGMSIAANKVKGIRAAKVSTVREAELTKEHNMANVITLSEYTENLEEIVDAFIDTENSKEERHIRRVQKIKELENAR
jgi:ribose 5-phosphate isomerase B